jgi:Flp pilus assembly protein TadG
MALVAPFVFFLIFSSIEFSRMMMVRQAMTNAVREGCRKAALVSTQDDAAADAIVREKLQGVIADCQNEDIVRVSFEPQFDSNSFLASGSPITADVEVDCEDISWLPPFLLQGIEIKTTCTMYRE